MQPATFRLARRPLYALLPMVALGVALWAFWPRATMVETARLERGPVTVAFNEEGRTRARRRFVIAAPIAGTIERLTHQPGDVVAPGEVLVTLHASRTGLLDPAARTRADADWREASAEAASALAAARAARAAERERQSLLLRVEALAGRRLLPQSDLEAARAQAASAHAHARAADARVDASNARLSAARSVLDLQGTHSSGEATLRLLSPVAGRVLRRAVESETEVQPGEALVEVADLRDLEVVADVLTEDAVQLHPGTAVIISNWGGAQTLDADVVRVEPGAFEKVSALGVEEQRVPVIVRFRKPPPSALGDGFRVDAQFIVWHAPATWSLPATALFRSGTRWAVYAIENGRARLRPVTPGHFGGDRVEIREGLPREATVILYPGDEVREGRRVRASP